MVGKLEVVFRLDAITIEVRIVRQLAILFQQLRRVAARPAVDPVELLSAAVTLTVAPAAPAVVPTIVVQGVRFPKWPVPPAFRLPDRMTLCHTRTGGAVAPTSARLGGRSATEPQMLE
jgi:hypothetical protein